MASKQLFSAPLQKVTTWLHGRFSRWVLKSKHSKTALRLDHKTLYVFPSKLGLGFLAIAGLNFVLAVNYQNNIVLVVAYLMLLILLVALLHAYSNCKGLQIKLLSCADVFAPSPVQVNLALSHQQKLSYSVILSWQNSQVEVEKINHSPTRVTLHSAPSSRGQFPLGTIKICSYFPFGLVKVWSYLAPPQPYFVYPAKVQTQKNTLLVNAAPDEGSKQQRLGGDEFYSLEPYQKGMNYKRISWRHYAKQQQLLVKQFSQAVSQQQVLDFAATQGTVEQRLSYLSYALNEAQRQNSAVALHLPQQQVAANNSAAHYQQCLRLLARFNQHIKTGVVT